MRTYHRGTLNMRLTSLDLAIIVAYLAGITDRVRLGTAVLLPALRHPVVLAQQLANVDQIARGRLLLGLGVGWSLPSAERDPVSR